MNTTPIWKRPWVIVLALVVIVGIVLVSAYNGLVTKATAVDTQWAQVETQYQRRFDLIPGLVESAKSIQTQEKEVFTALADARSRYAGAGSPEQKAEAASQLEGSLARLLVVVENYPQLRSSENIADFMNQLEGTENRVAVERNRYNEKVQEYNLAVMRLPGSVLARLFGFEQRAFFQATDTADKAPEVKF